MKLAYLTCAAALSLVATAAEDPPTGLRGIPQAETADGKIIPDFVHSDGSAYVLADLEKNFYCFEPEWADCNCYNPGSNECYPKCCTKTKGSCPNNHMPPCDNPSCTGNCVPQDDPDYDRNRPDPDNRLPCRANGDCAGGDFCQSTPPMGNQLGSCSPQNDGLCTEKPDACGSIYDPVCGCNGKTYSNECDATSKGKSVRCMGECPCSV